MSITPQGALYAAFVFAFLNSLFERGSALRIECTGTVARRGVARSETCRRFINSVVHFSIAGWLPDKGYLKHFLHTKLIDVFWDNVSRVRTCDQAQVAARPRHRA